MSNAKKYSSKRHQAPTKSSPLPLLLAMGGLVLVLLGIFFALRNDKPAAPYTPESTGGPKLTVDSDRVDLGDQKLGNTVSVSFKLKNVGDQPLTFSKEPYVEVKEGC